MKKLILLIFFCASLIQAQNNNRPKNNRKKAMNDDKKEMDNLAARSFSWLTGTSTDNDYVSVGKIAHYFGVISLRLDSNHSLSRGGVGKKTFQILSSQQQNEMLSLLEELKPHLKNYHKYNNLINRTLESKLRREYFNDSLCMHYAEKQAESEALIGIVSAKKFKKIYNSLSTSQIKQLTKMRQDIENKEPMEENISKEQKKKLKNITHENTLELWNISTRFMSWITGSEADNEFSPVGKTNQHFGFVKVRVASGHSITRKGVSNQVLELLNPSQKKMLQNHIAIQKPIMTQFLAKKADFTHELKKILTSTTTNDHTLLNIASEVGRLEGEMTIKQAQLYVNLRDTFTNEQIATLFKMRATYLPDDKKTPSSEKDLLERGKKVLNLCTMCHSLEKDKTIVGPSLYQIINKPSAQQEGYNYSPSMKSKNIIWNLKNLNSFLENPKKYVPNTTMPFSGLENKTDRKALLLYLSSLKN